MPFLQRRPNRSAGLCYVALTCLALSAMPAFAQELRLQELQSQSTPDASGLLNDIGKLLKSPADLLPSFSNPQTSPAPETEQQPLPPPVPTPSAKPAARTNTAVAPPAPTIAPSPAVPPAPDPPATTSTRLFPGMVSGREVCPRSANGAPDCQAGTDKLCQSKGYKSGKSLNMDSAFTCSPRQARAEGRKPCGTEHFVTSAFCS